MSISFVSTSAGFESWSHDAGAGTDRYLIVSFTGIVGGSLSFTFPLSVTYNGVSMYHIGNASNRYDGVSIWGLINPASGINTLAVTYSGTPNSHGNAISFDGVHQTVPIGDTATDRDGTESTNVPLSATLNGVWGNSHIFSASDARRDNTDVFTTIGGIGTSRWNTNYTVSSKHHSIAGASKEEVGTSATSTRIFSANNSASLFVAEIRSADGIATLDLVETVEISDSTKKEPQRSFAETVSANDSVDTTRIQNKIISDSVSVYGNATKEIQRTIIDTVAISGTISKGVSRLLTETISVIGNFGSSFVLVKNLVENIGIGEYFKVFKNGIGAGIWTKEDKIEDEGAVWTKEDKESASGNIWTKDEKDI